MKRRSFIQSSGGVLGAILVAKLGFSSGQAAKVAAADALAQKRALILKLLGQMGKSEAEAKAALAEIEGWLEDAKGDCLCRSCPTYVRREKGLAFCNAVAAPAKEIKLEKGCICVNCPVHSERKLTYSYYCTRKTEIEQLAAEKK